ncbi:MAG TPA: iron-sulfur cluster repair di-iron protein [Lachnospiraceae bacterium]|nr:iron-sulfur cluster repair di-iron protein [Lachnospiraceae bacterium]
MGTNMKYNEINQTIGEIVVSNPEAIQIFKEYSIDYCCGGNRLLIDVMKEQGLGEELLVRLEQARERRKDSYQVDRFDSMSPAVLSTYIEDTHHAFLRRSLPETADLLATILRVHGKNHMELFDVYRLFGQMKTDLEQHLMKEETMIFPEISEKSTKSEWIALMEEILREHEAVGDILRKLREVTDNYSIPEGVCNTFRQTYVNLEEIEKDLHQHIHLENNILFSEYRLK